MSRFIPFSVATCRLIKISPDMCSDGFFCKREVYAIAIYISLVKARFKYPYPTLKNVGH